MKDNIAQLKEKRFLLSKEECVVLDDLIEQVEEALGCSFPLSSLVRSLITLTEENVEAFIAAARARRGLKRPVNGDLAGRKEYEATIVSCLKESFSAALTGDNDSSPEDE